jgi:hypothetical protein
MKNKQSVAFKCVEGTGYFAENCKTREEAFELIRGEHPDGEDNDFDRTADELNEVIMYPCLDCKSSWVSDDVCGECGEYRLSKRGKAVWYLEC